MNFRSISFILVGFLFLLLQGLLFKEDDFLLIVFGLFFCVFYFILLLVSIGIDLYRLISDQDIIPFKPTIIGVVMIFMNIGFGNYLHAPYSDDLLINKYDSQEEEISFYLYKNGKAKLVKGDFLGSTTFYGHYAKSDNVIFLDFPNYYGNQEILVGEIQSKSYIQLIPIKDLKLHDSIVQN